MTSYVVQGHICTFFFFNFNRYVTTNVTANRANLADLQPC